MKNAWKMHDWAQEISMGFITPSINILKEQYIAVQFFTTLSLENITSFVPDASWWCRHEGVNVIFPPCKSFVWANTGAHASFAAK